MGGRPYIYLWSVSTRVGCEAQGIGNAMLQWVLGAADMHNVPVVLECTSAVTSELFFEKLGFKTIRSNHLPF